MSERSERFIFNILQHPRPFLPSVFSYGRLIRHFLSFLFHLFERFHSIYRVIMLLVFELFSQRIDHDIAYYERAQRAIHL